MQIELYVASSGTLLFFFSLNSILYRQKWVLFNKTEFRLATSIMNTGNLYLSYKMIWIEQGYFCNFLYNCIKFSYLIRNLGNKTQFYIKISVVWLLWSFEYKTEKYFDKKSFVKTFNFVFTKFNFVRVKWLYCLLP